MLIDPFFVLAEAHVLVSVWKPLLILPPFVAWAWFASTVMDKQAKRFFLGQEKWNGIHMLAGLIAIVAAFGMPIPNIAGFLVGYMVMLVVLAADIGLFVAVTNRDERVPEANRLRIDLEEWKKSRAERAEAKLVATVSLDIFQANGKRLMPPQSESPEYELRSNAEQFYIKASQARAQRVDVVPAREGVYAMSLMVDGVRQQGEPIPAAEAIEMIDFWKAAAGLDVGDRRRRLTGTVEIRTLAETTPMKVVTSGSKGGMRLTLQLDPRMAVRKKTSELGLLDPQYQAIEHLVADGTGVVLLASPPVGGRTTLMYSLIRMHDAYTMNVQTLELEQEDALEGVKQAIYDPNLDAEYAVQVRTLLRRDPDVLGIAEVPDGETAEEIAGSDIERTRTYASFVAADAMGALQQYMKLVGNNPLAAKGLRGIIVGRTARKLCENCRMEYQPTPEMLKKLGLPNKVQRLYKKGGQVLIRNKPEVCPVCGGGGYYGQTGVYEVFTLGPAERELLADGNVKAVAQQLRKAGQRGLKEAGLLKVVEGTTSVEELQRIFAPKSPPSSSKPRPDATPAA